MLDFLAFAFQLLVHHWDIFVNFILIKLESSSYEKLVYNQIAIGYRTVQVKKENGLYELGEQKMLKHLVDESVETEEESENYPIREPFLSAYPLFVLQGQHTFINRVEISYEQKDQALSNSCKKNNDGQNSQQNQ